jgi:hypothetical protein
MFIMLLTIPLSRLAVVDFMFFFVFQINAYKEKFYEETLVLVTEGNFNLLQVSNSPHKMKT